MAPPDHRTSHGAVLQLERAAQLDRLISALEGLVEILEQDPSCRWTRHFQSSLQAARDFKRSGFGQSQLNELSGSIRHVFGGSGSFSDYYAPKPQLREEFSAVAGEVFESAFSLAVVGSV